MDNETSQAQEDVSSAVFDSVDAADTDAKCEEAIVMDYLHLTKFNFDTSDGSYPDSFSKITPLPEQLGALLIAKTTLILAVETRRLRWVQESANDSAS